MTDWFVDIAKGEVTGHSVVHKFGYNENVGFSAPVVVWSHGTTPYPWPETAGLVIVSSTDINDCAGGTGARTIVLEGLDDKFKPQSEVITLGGIYDIESTKEYFRLHRMYVDTCGPNPDKANIGEIHASIGGDVVAEICAGTGQTLMAIYTVPANMTGYLISIWMAVDRQAASATDFTFFVRRKADEVDAPFRATPMGGTLETTGTTSWQRMFDVPVKYEGPTDIYVAANAGSVRTGASAGFCMILTENE